MFIRISFVCLVFSFWCSESFTKAEKLKYVDSSEIRSYRFNHPPAAEDYQDIPVAIVIDGEDDPPYKDTARKGKIADNYEKGKLPVTETIKSIKGTIQVQKFGDTPEITRNGIRYDASFQNHPPIYDVLTQTNKGPENKDPKLNNDELEKASKLTPKEKNYNNLNKPVVKPMELQLKSHFTTDLQIPVVVVYESNTQRIDVGNQVKSEELKSEAQSSETLHSSISQEPTSVKNVTENTTYKSYVSDTAINQAAISGRNSRRINTRRRPVISTNVKANVVDSTSSVIANIKDITNTTHSTGRRVVKRRRQQHPTAETELNSEEKAKISVNEKSIRDSTFIKQTVGKPLNTKSGTSDNPTENISLSVTSTELRSKSRNKAKQNDDRSEIRTTPTVFTSRNVNKDLSYNNTLEKKSDQKPVIPIIKSESTSYQHGDYQFSYESGDGTIAFQKGEQKVVNETSGSAVVGSYSYKDKEGNDYSLSYTADENGYRPVGDHLPTPPPIPPAIVLLLKHLATKPTPEPSSTTEPTKFVNTRNGKNSKTIRTV